jgi:hypothetical protein
MRRVWFALMVAAFLATAGGAAVAVDPPSVVPAPVVVEGIITDVTITTPASGTITVQPPAPCATCPDVAPVTFAVNEQTQLFKDGKVCKLPDIKVGDSCRALCIKDSTGALVARLVYAKTVVPPLKWVAGKIVEKALVAPWGRTFRLALTATTNSTALVMWFKVDNTTKITLDGNPATYDDLAVGQLAEVGFLPPPPSPLTVIQPILAAVVAAKSPPPPPITHVIGKLVGIDLDNRIITVLPRDARCTDVSRCAVSFKITDATKIYKFGLVTLDKLTLGDTVDVTARLISTTPAPPVAISVVVLPETLMGIVDKVDLAAGIVWIVQRNVAGVVTPAIPIKVVPATKIIRNGRPVPLSEIAKGDIANVIYFQFGPVKVAALIDAKSLTITP